MEEEQQQGVIVVEQRGLTLPRSWRLVAKSSAAAVGALALLALLATRAGSSSGDNERAGPLRGLAAESVQAVAVVGSKDPKQIVEMAGRKWEFTDNEDCWGHDLATIPVQHIWGSAGAVPDREKCAEECTKHYLCVAFNFPNEHFPDPSSPYDPQVCYLKYTHMHSKKVDMTCEKGFLTHIWHYYTLVDGDVWHRQSEGFRISEYPFRTRLPVTNAANLEWISGIRWERGDGLKCNANELASYPAKASESEQAGIEECAAKCIDARECVAFHFPKKGEEGKWVSGGSDPACRLLTGMMKNGSLQHLHSCTDGDHSSAWKSYTLADAWEMKRNEHDDWERKQRRPVWTGGLGDPCAPPPAGHWILPEGEIEEPPIDTRRLKRRLASLPCCKWSLSRCREDVTKTCTPIAGFPEDCIGMCGMQTANCSCWSQEDVQDVHDNEEGCCTSCRYDCTGKQTCLPAGCAGAHKMCKSTLASGSTCSCAAGVEGGDSPAEQKKKTVPADVAAGWSVEDKEWTS